MSNTGADNYFDIVEGLGATIGPGYIFSSAIGGEYNIQLECFFTNASKPALNPPLDKLFWHRDGAFSNAGSCNLAVNELPDSWASFIAPNPANRTSKIVLPRTLQRGRLLIYNALGQVVSGAAVSNAAAVPLPDMPPVRGLYFYRLTDESLGSAFTGTFFYD
jgi:hypothetical protein